jgi:hypothetical protein
MPAFAPVERPVEDVADVSDVAIEDGTLDEDV